MTGASVEGDPIVVYYRVRGRDLVEVFTDAARDRVDDLGWLHQRCEGIEAQSPTDDGLPRALVTTGCAEIPLDDPVP